MIELMGIGLEIFVAVMYFETWWITRKLKRKWLLSGCSLLAMLNLTVLYLFHNEYLRLVTFFIIMFSLSFYFISSTTSKILHGFVITAIMFTSEMLVGVFTVKQLGVTANQIQGNSSIYMTGVLGSKLFSLFLVCLIRVFMSKNKQESGTKFNLLMTFLPLQSIVLCFIIYRYSVYTSLLETSTLGMIAVAISLFSVFVIIFVLNNQLKAMEYKKKYDLAQVRLKMQIEHYQKLYQAHYEVRLVRHEISNSLLAISGALSQGLVKESLDRINTILADVKRAAEIVDTGLPAVDAVIDAKLAKASESEIEIVYKMIIDCDMNIDQFDLAIIIANSLDNAIEGIKRSCNVDRRILLNIASESDYLHILVENPMSGLVDGNFETSKPDKSNHGFGLAQMRAVAQKYDGYIHPAFNSEIGRFSLIVLLKNPSA